MELGLFGENKISMEVGWCGLPIHRQHKASLSRGYGGMGDDGGGRSF